MLKSKEKNKKEQRNKISNNLKQSTYISGITLIALVVTIVILLILAAVTLNLVLAEGGLFNRARETGTAQKIAEYKDKFEIARVTTMLNKDNLGNVPIDAFLEEIKNEGIVKNDSQIVSNGDGSYTVTPEEGIDIIVKPTDDGKDVEITYPSTGGITTGGTGGSTGGDTGDDGSGDDSGSGTGGDGGTTTVPVTKIELNKTSTNLVLGGNLILTATITPSDATDKTVTWTSSNTNVATVSGNGLTATVIASATTTGNTTITAKTTDGSFEATCEIIVENQTVESLIGQEASDTNTYTQDKYGNPIVIPSGFTVVANGEEGVVYDYASTDGKSPVVQDGIVIEDGEGNQFVWVPVGEIKNDSVENTTNITNIKLGRYENFTMGTNNAPPEPKQEATVEGYNTAISIEKTTTEEYFENMSGICNEITYNGNTKAYNLEEWIRTSLANEGYYIARYEASYGTDRKPNSKPSEGTPSSTSISEPTTEGQLWNWVKQSTAATRSKNMYLATEGVEYYSDLMNSYAWDTAIIFIQAYSGNTTYASQKSNYTNSSGQPANTGERGANATVEGSENTTDKVCNIYDMASNLSEWTTETCTYDDKPCVHRGGYFSNTYYTSSRHYYGAMFYDTTKGFRPILCVSSDVN